MKKILLVALLFGGMMGMVHAQYSWTQKTDLGGMKRQAAVGFAIGNKGYIAIGLNYETNAVLNDLWQYDPTSDSWTQKADYAGPSRVSAVSFVIGNTAYVGSGCSNYPSTNYVNDFWAYDATANSWSAIASFPGSARYGGTSFAIGTKGYFGTGWQNNSYFNDLWEYNSGTNTWSQKTNFPGSARCPTSFAIGNNGYVGGGEDGSSPVADFWKYHNATDTWSQIADLPSNSYETTSFVMLGKGFVGTGSTTWSFADLYSHWWSYDTTANSWSAIQDMPGVPRLSAVAFSVNKCGYCGTGAINNYVNDLQDFYKYAPTNSEGINDISYNLSDISIYPNISNGKISIEYSSSKNSSLEIKILSIEGKVVHSELKNQLEGINQFSLDLTNKAKGIYFVEMLSGSDKTVKKIVLE